MMSYFSTMSFFRLVTKVRVSLFSFSDRVVWILPGYRNEQILKCCYAFGKDTETALSKNQIPETHLKVLIGVYTRIGEMHKKNG
jgi:hypothetical protein